MNYRAEDIKWAEEVWEKLQKKLSVVSERVKDILPGDADENGKFVDRGNDIFWWTNGFWAGLLWQMYHATGEESYKVYAEVIEKKLDTALEEFWGLHHDVGFMWSLSAVADYRLTGNEKSKNRGLHAANILAGRYNPNGHFIRAWNPECDPSLDTRGLMIIDCLMNLPLLYWADELTDDHRYYTIAKEHADTALRYILREDGSCNHIVQFDSETGEFVKSLGGQGYGEGSSWSRGQSWAVYGMTLSYLYTKEERYLDAAKQAAHYFIANAALTDYIPLLDFRAPQEPKLVDTTAGVITACGLLELSKHVGELERPLYVESAMRMLRAMVEKCCDWDEETDAILGYGSGAYHKDVHHPIIYGDYFLLEAVLRILGKDTLLW